MSYLRLLLVMTVVLFFSSCNMDGDDHIIDTGDVNYIDEELTEVLVQSGGSLGHYILPASDDLNSIPQDPKNPLSRAKVQLGKLLFHETALATASKFDESMSTYSCASCHHAAGGFQANLAQGIGDGGIGFGLDGGGRYINPHNAEVDIDVQPIRTPSALNIAYQTNVLWNGQFGATGINVGTEDQWKENTPIAENHLGFEGTEIQAIAGLNVHRFGFKIDEDFIMNTDYKELFDVAFGDISEMERYNSVTAGLAIAAYERTLLANQSPFQQWLKGDDRAMTSNEKQGAIAFFNNGCGSCHNGPALNSMTFHAYGMGDLCDNQSAINATEDDGANLGRGGFTKVDEDRYKFKVPQLYNLRDSRFYGHGSSFTSVEDVVRYKNEGHAQNDRVPSNYLSSEFKSLSMNETEIQNITTFILSALHDPNLSRYEPEALPSGQCFPNNDALSKVDLGCI